VIDGNQGSGLVFCPRTVGRQKARPLSFFLSDENSVSKASKARLLKPK